MPGATLRCDGFLRLAEKALCQQERDNFRAHLMPYQVEPSGLGPEYRVVALAATLAVRLSLFSPASRLHVQFWGVPPHWWGHAFIPRQVTARPHSCNPPGPSWALVAIAAPSSLATHFLRARSRRVSLSKAQVN